MILESNLLKIENRENLKYSNIRKKNKLLTFNKNYKILIMFFIFLIIIYLLIIKIKYDIRKILESILNVNLHLFRSMINNTIIEILNINTKNNFKEFQSKVLKKNFNKIPISDEIETDSNNILLPYIKQQNDFCNNNTQKYNKLIEEQIILQEVNLSGIIYEMYVYRQLNFMTGHFKKYKSYEKVETINILEALQYYGKKKNITNNKNIFMLDIGGNIGWYPSFLGRFGYSILSFEPLETNYYVLNKNYCLMNNNSNVVIITKGIDNEEKTCDYYVHVNNPGNGMVLCDKKKINNNYLNNQFKKLKEVSLTKLSNFIPYLSDKNLALIKVDIEGAEGKAFESGIELL